MDIFLEKIVKRKKTPADIAFTAGMFVLATLLIVILGNIRLIQSLWPLLVVGIGYLAYMMVKARNIEYEYIVTNGDLDIDMIIAQRKRKRIFSANCKDFDIVAKMTSGQFDHNMQSIKKRINAVSSMQSQDVYFISMTKDSEKLLVFFEPHPKMLESFKKYIPRKVFE